MDTFELNENIKSLVAESLEITIDNFQPENLLLKCSTWDSIGLLTIIANFKDRFEVTLDGKIMNGLKTFAELYHYIQSMIK
jgi:acyl carrier protein